MGTFHQETVLTDGQHGDVNPQYGARPSDSAMRHAFHVTARKWAFSVEYLRAGCWHVRIEDYELTERNRLFYTYDGL